MENKLKEIAKAFLQGVVTDRVREVYDLYTLPELVHHNAFYKGDRASLLEGILENNHEFPNKKVNIKLAISEPGFKNHNIPLHYDFSYYIKIAWWCHRIQPLRLILSY